MIELAIAALILAALAALLAVALTGRGRGPIAKSVAYRLAILSGRNRIAAVYIGARALVRYRLERRAERRRRARLSPAERLLEDQAATLKPPDELPRAADVTRAQRRHNTARVHPIARKRRTGGWR